MVKCEFFFVVSGVRFQAADRSLDLPKQRDFPRCRCPVLLFAVLAPLSWPSLWPVPSSATRPLLPDFALVQSLLPIAGLVPSAPGVSRAALAPPTAPPRRASCVASLGCYIKYISGVHFGCYIKYILGATGPRTIAAK